MDIALRAVQFCIGFFMFLAFPFMTHRLLSDPANTGFEKGMLVVFGPPVLFVAGAISYGGICLCLDALGFKHAEPETGEPTKTEEVEQPELDPDN